MNMNACRFDYRVIIVTVLLSLGVRPAMAQETDSPSNADVATDTLTRLHGYNHRVYKVQSKWMKAIPNLYLAQFAGNIGFLSAGIGWDYGRNDRWETHLLLGYVPEMVMSEGMFTSTIRQTLSPWQIECNGLLTITPAVFSFSINTVFNNEFWFTESERYPGDYYRFSSKLRAQIGIGGRVNLHFTNFRRKVTDRISLYYDLSTYDLALISYVPNRSIHFTDILALGIGIEYRFF